jgi:hypothetical protein
MKKIILALALVAGLTLFAGDVNAGQTFNWNFTGNANLGGIPSNDDQISGVLTLNDQATEAISLIVTSNLSGNLKYNSQDFAPNAYLNSFVVSNGNITQASFSSSIYLPPINGVQESYQLALNWDHHNDGNPVTYYSYFSQNNNNLTSQDNLIINRSGSLSAISFSNNPIPTPTYAPHSYNFSFTGNANLGGIPSNDDQISGILTLNDQETEAISMIVTSNLSGNLKFNSQDFASNANLNSFVVSNGNITQASFSSSIYLPPINGIEESYQLALNWDYHNDGNPVTYYSYFSQNNNTLTSQDNLIINRSGSLSAISFSPIVDPTAVPEPSTYALFGIGAIGMLMVLRRKKTV